MRQYLGKQPGVVTVSGDDPKRFAAAMVEYTKEKVGRGVGVGKKVGGHALWDGWGGGGGGGVKDQCMCVCVSHVCGGHVPVCLCATCEFAANI